MSRAITLSRKLFSSEIYSVLAQSGIDKNERVPRERCVTQARDNSACLALGYRTQRFLRVWIV